MNLKLKDEHLPRLDWLDLRNRIVSVIHGTAILFLSAYNTFFVHSGCGERNTNLEYFLMQFSNGYFMYDLLAMAYLGILDKSMLIHHNICISGLTAGLITGYSADNLISALFLAEISNPAMHIRVILRLLGLRYTKAYETSEVTYMSKYSI
jgi:TLC domain